MAHIVRFDSYEVDLFAGQLYRRGTKLRLRDKSFQILAALLEHPGEVVTRRSLRRQLWQEDVFVDFENNLNAAIARLRQVLGDSRLHPRYIETLPRHGYRFIGRISAELTVATRAPTAKARLLVLPFLNLTGDPAQEYFSDAMTDEIITALVAIAPAHLAIIARSTAMHYKHSRKDVAHIGRELGVDYVVEGGVRRSGDMLFLNVQLIQAHDQTHLFAQKYNAEMTDIFNLHGLIAGVIAQHLPVIAEAMRDGTELPERIRRKPTQDLVAYNEYIKGRYAMWKLTPAAMAEAKLHFEAALAHDPRFALACNALAELYWYTGLGGFAPSRQTDSIARSYVLRAQEIDNTSPETHALLSFFPGKRDSPEEIDYYNWEEIQQAIAYARGQDPMSRLVLVRYAMVLAILGQVEEAAEELRQLLESDPLSLDARSWLVIMLYLGRHLDQALEELLRMRELEPEHFLPYYQLGQVYLMMRRFEESISSFEKAIELSHDLPLVLGFYGLSLGWSGRTSEGQAVLDRLNALARQQYVLPTSFAWANLGLGNIDEVFFWLDRAVDAPDRFMEPIRTFPFLDPLRDDSRFALLLHKMNLA